MFFESRKIGLAGSPARTEELQPAARELSDLISIVQQWIGSPTAQIASVLAALQALLYLRNPYDAIFDVVVPITVTDEISIAEGLGAWS